MWLDLCLNYFSYCTSVFTNCYWHAVSRLPPPPGSWLIPHHSYSSPFLLFNSPKFIGCLMLQNISRSIYPYLCNIFVHSIVSIHNHCVWRPGGVPSMRMYFRVFKSFTSFYYMYHDLSTFQWCFEWEIGWWPLRLLDLLTDDITKKPAIVVLRSLAEENEAFSRC